MVFFFKHKLVILPNLCWNIQKNIVHKLIFFHTQVFPFLNYRNKHKPTILISLNWNMFFGKRTLWSANQILWEKSHSTPAKCETSFLLFILEECLSVSKAVFGKQLETEKKKKWTRQHVHAATTQLCFS